MSCYRNTVDQQPQQPPLWLRESTARPRFCLGSSQTTTEQSSDTTIRFCQQAALAQGLPSGLVKSFSECFPSPLLCRCQTCINIWRPTTFSGFLNFFFQGISPNKSVAHLILSWHLVLRSLGQKQCFMPFHYYDNPRYKYYCPHFPDKKTETQSG